MFKNKNWYKVLMPKLIGVVATLALFFGCRLAGMNDKNAADTTSEVLGVSAFVALAFGFAAMAGIAPTITLSITLSKTAFVNIADAIIMNAFAIFAATTTFNTVSDIAFYIATIAALTILTASDAARNYGVSKFWATVSCQVQAAAIFLPIFLTLN